MWFGAYFMSAISEIDSLDLSASLSPSSIENQWTATTWTVMLIALMITVLGTQTHLYVLYMEGLVLDRLAVLAMVLGVFLIPFVKQEAFHPHHW